MGTLSYAGMITIQDGLETIEHKGFLPRYDRFDWASTIAFEPEEPIHGSRAFVRRCASLYGDAGT